VARCGVGFYSPTFPRSAPWTCPLMCRRACLPPILPAHATLRCLCQYWWPLLRHPDAWLYLTWLAGGGLIFASCVSNLDHFLKVLNSGEIIDVDDSPLHELGRLGMINAQTVELVVFGISIRATTR